MKVTKNNSKLVWLGILVFVIAVAYLGYFVFRLNSNNTQTVANKNIETAPPNNKPEVNKEDTATGTIIKTGNSQYGPMLFDSKDQAIYIWQLEDSTTAACYGDCAKEWPPVLTNGTPVATGEVNSQLLGTTKRTDGTTQVTYNGHPLYFYAHEKAGEVKCHNVRSYGGLWWVIQPNGVRAS